MAITFDPANKRVILDSASVTATELYSRSCDWLATAENIKYGAIFRQVGSDDLGAGLSIPPYYFLQGAWRVRPMESNHNLTITGNLFVEGGGVPVVQTLGTYQVNVNYTVPVQAQGISTAGGGSGPTVAEIVAGIMAQAQITPIHANAVIGGGSGSSSNLTFVTGPTPLEVAAETLAQALITPIHAAVEGGGSAGATKEEIASAVKASLAIELSKLDVPISSRVASGEIVSANVMAVNDQRITGQGKRINPWGPV